MAHIRLWWNWWKHQPPVTIALDIASVVLLGWAAWLAYQGELMTAPAGATVACWAMSRGIRLQYEVDDLKAAVTTLLIVQTDERLQRFKEEDGE